MISKDDDNVNVIVELCKIMYIFFLVFITKDCHVIWRIQIIKKNVFLHFSLSLFLSCAPPLQSHLALCNVSLGFVGLGFRVGMTRFAGSFLSPCVSPSCVTSSSHVIPILLSDLIDNQVHKPLSLVTYHHCEKPSKGFDFSPRGN